MNNESFDRIRELLRSVPFWGLLVLVFLLGFLFRGGGGETQVEHADHQVAVESTEQATVWTCSMHPQVRQPEPGRCPICGMELIPANDGAGDDDLGPRQIRLSETARELAELRTATVERRRVKHKMRLPGKVTYDETTVEHITSWVGGRIDKLFVDYTGMKVSRGQRIAELYSPELYSAQEEFLQALKGERQFKNSSLTSIRNTAKSTVEAARRKLELLGMSESQVQEVIERGAPSTHMRINAPLSGTVVEKRAMVGMYVKAGSTLYRISDLNTVWVELQAYEQDLQWLAKDRNVIFMTPAYPGVNFEGKIDFIDPVLNPKSRTVKVRVVAPNRDGRLKPDMLVTAAVEYQAQADSETRLMIPATAPLITGKRALVYVRMPADHSVFEGREVVLGPRAGDFYIVREGLNEGDEIVTNGAFKIDAAVQITAKPSMMNPAGGATGSAGMHDHSAMEGQDSAPVPAAAKIEGAKLPEDFTDGLSELYKSYFWIQEELAADNYENALEAGDSFARVLQGRVKMSALNSVQHRAWMEFHKRMQRETENLVSAGDISAARESFEKLSSVIADAVRTFGGYGDSPIVLFHCPMAFDNRGAEWLQNDDNTRNPYYGSMMLRCQDRIDTLYSANGKGR